MKVVVTGASGLIGSALVDSLRGDGHSVVRLVRRTPAAADEAQWDPAAGTVDDAAIADADAVVHLAGAGIGDRRWTPAYKKLVRDSRIDGTTTIANAVARHAYQVKVLVSGSAIGWYGDRGDDVLTESEPVGSGFLAELVHEWEACTAAASVVGVRVVKVRTGIVLAPRGGALGRMLPIFKLGLGGRLGSGRQWFSWISLGDEVAALRYAIDHELRGPVNLTAPEPVTNREFTATLGKALYRPAVAAVPRFALRVALGEFADEGVLASQRVMPTALLDAGFAFQHNTLDTALEAIL
ncbi:MAG TPA: TIGR01777 family oxidoreductase [Mycobacteriales bacterium]|nr:TIGR01777 family oxidoreductase [Mycobacteriales bacterium]